VVAEAAFDPELSSTGGVQSLGHLVRIVEEEASNRVYGAMLQCHHGDRTPCHRQVDGQNLEGGMIAAESRNRSLNDAQVSTGRDQRVADRSDGGEHCSARQGESRGVKRLHHDGSVEAALGGQRPRFIPQVGEFYSAPVRPGSFRAGDDDKRFAVEDLGVDLICATVGYADARAMRQAVLDAVAAGELPEERIADAAERVRRLRAWCRPEPHGQPDAAVGLAAARRALRVHATGLPLPAEPYVIDAGVRVRPGVGATSVSLRELLGADGVTLLEPPADVAGLVAAADPAKPLVLTVRDAHTRPWQRELITAAAATRPDYVVIGTGTAADGELAPGHYIGALGCGRPNLQAVAELLQGERL